MGASQRVSRGFHRLGLFLASVALLIGGFLAMLFAPDWAAPFPAKWGRQPVPQGFSGVGGPIVDIEGLAKVRMPSNYNLQPIAKQRELVNRIIANNWREKFAIPLERGLLIALAFSLVLYGLVRAIGWVIGGFMAS